MARTPKFEDANFVCPPGRALPDMIERYADVYWAERRNMRLRVMLARSPADDARGTIVFCPGRTEFIEKYFETIEDFLKLGFSVLMIDPRGQGLSGRMLDDPLKSYVRDFQDYADDLSYVVDQFSEQLPKPHIAMGHSMGGLVALQAVLSGVMNPSAVVCSAPMLGLFDIETSIMSYMIRIASSIGFSKQRLPFQKQEGGLPVPFKGNKLTSDETRFTVWAEYFQTIPELRVGPPTYAWICAGMKAMAYVNRNAAQLKIPGLIVAAGGDPIVDPASNQRFCEAAGIDYHVVPGALHELFLEQERYRVQFFKRFEAFLEDNAL